MDAAQKIEKTLSRSVCGGWDRGFLESILQQLSKGQTLSIKQRETLGKVLARNTKEDQKRHHRWESDYRHNYEKDARILAIYHRRQPYYQPMASDILAGRVPERSKFLRMYDNKYSKKVIVQYRAASKYAVGEYLIPRASFDSYKHIELERDMVWAVQNKIIQNFRKRGGFVIEVCDEIYSAAKGAKRYKLLPIGETMPVIIEERHLKKNTKNK